eukprot:12587469-Heterocapsa_arctica.AAC.1
MTSTTTGWTPRRAWFSSSRTAPSSNRTTSTPSRATTTTNKKMICAKKKKTGDQDHRRRRGVQQQRVRRQGHGCGRRRRIELSQPDGMRPQWRIRSAVQTRRASPEVRRPRRLTTQ